MLFIETKEGLEPSRIEHNIIWADYSQDAPAAVRDNNMKSAFADSLNFSKPPVFLDDQTVLPVFSACFFPKKGYSEIYLGDRRLAPDILINRIVKSGDNWGVVKSNKEATMVVWGAFSAITEITVLPTYTINE
jgi:hypothetical protein